jgi:hypothetical protein
MKRDDLAGRENLHIKKTILKNIYPSLGGRNHAEGAGAGIGSLVVFPVNSRAPTIKVIEGLCVSY